MTDELLMTDGKVALSVFLTTVTIEVNVGDEYAAQVLFDDLTERLQRGQGITLGFKQPGGS